VVLLASLHVQLGAQCEQQLRQDCFLEMS